MSEEKDFKHPWAILKLSGQFFAISVKHVETMVVVPDVVSVPDSPDYIKGVIDLRGKIFPLVDMRVRLGLSSLEEESVNFIKKIDMAKEEHLTWLKELESSIEENRPFTLTTDPHKCAFGKWYDSVVSQDLFLSRLLKNINQPHQEIYNLALKVEQLKKDNQSDEINKIIANIKSGAFTRIMECFEIAQKEFLEDRNQIAVAINADGRSFALAVDSVESVEDLKEEGAAKEEDLEGINQETTVKYSIGKTMEDKMIVVISDVATLVDPDVDVLVYGEDSKKENAV